MSLITSSSASTNFGVKTQIPSVPANRTPALTTGRVFKQNLGTAGTAIPPAYVLGHTIVVSPSTGLQTYTLPTASAILAEFGKSIDTGVPKISVGDSLVLRVVNRGSSAAFIASNPTGGDGTAIIAYTGSSAAVSGAQYTGSVVPVGKLTTLYLEWLQVNGGVNGATGLYTVYA